MTKDVLISFSAVQFNVCSEEDDKERAVLAKTDMAVDKTESTIQGMYYKKNSKHYLLYDEAMEGFKETVKTKVKFGEGGLEIVRSGPVSVRMLFEENTKNMTSYNTPYGNIILGINTKKISISDSPDNILVSVDYSLESDDKPVSECSISIKIQSVFT